MVEIAEVQPNTWGAPNDEEMAAIIAALDQLWSTTPARKVATTPPWRFSGRWWR